MMAISMFGALFTWMMIFVTHYFFRRRWAREGGAALSFRMPGFPLLTLLGAGAMLAILVTTYFTGVFKMTLVFGVPFLLVLAALYLLLFRKSAAAVVLQARQQRS
jgi:L-asparagine transporter-like permease